MNGFLLFAFHLYHPLVSSKFSLHNKLLEFDITQIKPTESTSIKSNWKYLNIIQTNSILFLFVFLLSKVLSFHSFECERTKVPDKRFILLNVNVQRYPIKGSFF